MQGDSARQCNSNRPLRVGEIFLCLISINSPTPFARRGMIFCKPTSKCFSKTRNFLHMAQQKQLNFFITLTIIFEFHFCWLGRIHMFSYSSYFISVSKEFTDVEVEELISFISLSFWRFNFLSFLRTCFLVHRQLIMQTWYPDI